MRIIAAALLVFATTQAIAESRCLPADTPRQCVQRLITTRANDNAQAALAATNPGTSTVASPIRSAVKDFLSAGSAHLDGSSVKDSGTALIIDYNLLKRFNLEGTFPDAAPSPAAATTTTPPQLSRGDDILVTLSYNLLTRRFGRNVDRSLFDSMLLALMSNTAPATAAVPTTAYDTPFVQLLPDADARVAAIAEYETAAIAAVPAAADQLTKDLGALANNQPQLFASGLYRRRAPEVGPDQHGFRVTWEIGTDNLNTFRDHEGRDCETRGDCLAAFTNFAARTAKRHRTSRLALAIQYGKTALNSVGNFNEVPTKGFTYMATYGQEISSFTAQPTRFDIALTYDGTKTARSFTAGGMSIARIAAAAADITQIPPSSIHEAVAFTITQPVAKGLSVPVSIVRVTHDDWFPTVPSNVSFPYPTLPVPLTHRRHVENELHLGIRYQIPSFTHPPPCCCQ